ncbi:hypothetical protein HYV31_00635 [candidate division WWE3 bacterium]|nr:hypothetical protein [candidate division WWE3 bacterium]
MEKLEFLIHDDVIAIIDKIRNFSGSNIELFFPDGSVVFDNGLNLRLIKKECDKLNKTVLFSTNDPEGKYLVSLVDDVTREVSGDSNSDFVSREVSLDEVTGITTKNSIKSSKFTMSTVLPNLSRIRGIKTPLIKFPKLGLNFGLIVMGILFAGLIAGFAYWYFWTIPKADVNIVLKSEPLVKSLQITVENGGKNSASLRTLEGRIFSSTLTETVKTDATGSKLIGEKAGGKIKVINRTTTAKTFKKGEKLHYKEDDDLLFSIDDDLTVPGAQLQDPLDVNSALVPGNAEVSTTATEFGKSYNISKGKTFEFEKYSTTDYIAEVTTSFSGGSSEQVKVVTQVDLDKLATDIALVFKEKGPQAVKSGVQQGWVLINGSETSTSISKKYNKKVDDVSNEVELVETVNYQGLGYSSNGLNSLLNDLLAEFITKDYELSKESRDIKAEVLGNTDKTVLTTSKADLQVTVKAFIVPVLNADNIKNSLLGVSFTEAERLLNEIKNIKTYGINMTPKVSLLKRIPKNIANVNLNITLE